MTGEKEFPKRAFSPLLRGLWRRAAGARRQGICIGGYAGCGNLGDDAILQAYLNGLRDRRETRPVVVLSGSPRRDSKRFGVRCVSRRNPLAILAVFLQCEEFLCGGGSLLQNVTGERSLLYYLFLLRTARALGCRPSLLAAGIGPIEGEKARERLLSALRLCERVEVRDSDSQRFLLSLGVERYRLRLVPDPAQELAAPPPERLSFLLSENGIATGTRYLCAVLRPADPTLPLSPLTVAASIRTVCEKHGLLPVFLVFDSHRDAAVTHEVCKRTNGRIIRLREASDALAVLSGAEFTLAMRFHALVLSHSVGTPALGLSHSLSETKLESFCRSVSFPHLRLPEVSIVSLALELEDALGKKEDFRGENS